MSERVLVVEDEPYRRVWFRQACVGCPLDETDKVAEALDLLTANAYTQIFLDHDLADEHYSVYSPERYDDRFDEETGYAVAKWLAENPDASRDAEIVIHSLNEPAARRMGALLRESGRRVRLIPFLKLREIAVSRHA